MHAQIRVLLADDADSTRRGWKAILDTDSDIEIVGEAKSQLEALNKVKELDPDIVLMDLKWGLDKTAGWTAIREMKKINNRSKIIAITAHDELIPDARRSGADTAISKDVAGEELLSYIKDLYKGQFDLKPDQAQGDPLGVLTPRELDVLYLVAEGLSDKEIAERLVITESTAKNHLRSVLDKLDAKNRTHAVAIARERGILK